MFLLNILVERNECKCCRKNLVWGRHNSDERSGPRGFVDQRSTMRGASQSHGERWPAPAGAPCRWRVRGNVNPPTRLVENLRRRAQNSRVRHVRFTTVLYSLRSRSLTSDIRTPTIKKKHVPCYIPTQNFFYHNMKVTYQCSDGWDSYCMAHIHKKIIHILFKNVLFFQINIDELIKLTHV